MSWSRETYLVKYLLRKMKQIYYIFPIELNDSNNIYCYQSVSIILCVSKSKTIHDENYIQEKLKFKKYVYDTKIRNSF